MPCTRVQSVQVAAAFDAVAHTPDRTFNRTTDGRRSGLDCHNWLFGKVL